MGEEERLAFESQLLGNPDLAERVRMHRGLEEALGNKKEMEVEANLRAIMEEASEDLSDIEPEDSSPAPTEPSAPNRTRRLWAYFSAAAAVALLFIAVRFFFFGPTNPNELFEQHYVAYDGSNEVRSVNGVPPNLLDTAFDAYIDRNYTKAEKAFQQILDSVPTNARARFYLGICQLENGFPDTASEAFKRVIADGMNLYISQAHWYLAMSCLKQSDLDCAKSELEGLIEKPGVYREKATDILEEL